MEMSKIFPRPPSTRIVSSAMTRPIVRCNSWFRFGPAKLARHIHHHDAPMATRQATTMIGVLREAVAGPDADEVGVLMRVQNRKRIAPSARLSSTPGIVNVLNVATLLSKKRIFERV